MEKPQHKHFLWFDLIIMINCGKDNVLVALEWYWGDGLGCCNKCYHLPLKCVRKKCDVKKS